MTKKSPENEILAKGKFITHVKEVQTGQKSNLICIMSRPIHIPNFRSVSQKTGEKNLENYFFANSKYLKGRLRKVRKTEWTDRRRGNK